MTCPVCGISLDIFPDRYVAAAHVHDCRNAEEMQRFAEQRAVEDEKRRAARSAVPEVPPEVRRQRKAHEKAYRQYWSRRDERIAYNRQWRAEHPEYEKTPEQRAYQREYARKNAAKKNACHREWSARRFPGYVPQEIRLLQARELEDIVLELHRDGWLIREIAEKLGRSWSGCQHALARARKRTSA